MLSKYKILSTGVSVSLMLAVAGCHSKPGGQVVATVNGEEISLQELNAELSGLKIPENADKQLVKEQALQQIINRRLLVQAAKKEGLDRSPDYILQQRRMSEDLLVRLYAKKVSDTIHVPDTKAVDTFIASHPDMFAQRKRYHVDQIVFPMPRDTQQLKQLEPDHSLSQVEASLSSMGIKYEKRATVMDSASAPLPLLQQVQNLPAGEPFIVPQGGMVTANVITGSEGVSLTPEQQRPLAIQAMRNESLNDIGGARLKEAKAGAKIEYQSGYAPPASAKTN